MSAAIGNKKSRRRIAMYIYCGCWLCTGGDERRKVLDLIHKDDMTNWEVDY